MESWTVNTITTDRRTEFYVSLKPDKSIFFTEQLDSLLENYNMLLEHLVIEDSNLVSAKIFLSDYMNQKESLEAHSLYHNRLNGGAISVIEQPPLNGNKINILLMFVKSPGIKKTKCNEATFADIDGHTHIYQSLGCEALNPSDLEHQTGQTFAIHKNLLQQKGMTILDNCVRTWLYIRDIDRDYPAVVKGRNSFFADNGLTPDTHFIASTGIGGSGKTSNTALTIDFYSVSGLRSEQVKYLKAPNFLNPTHEYGVSFERGTAITYPDVKHIFISGTASIDKNGSCIHNNNVIHQLERTFINMDNLLKDADASLANIVQMIVYIRDIADYKAVDKYVSNKFNCISNAIVQARVCRPQWLIEVECIAALPTIRQKTKIKDK